MRDAVTPDFESCVMMARGFYKAAGLCSDDFDFMPVDLQAPCVVNLIFACELGLKAILIHERGCSAKTHKLWDLYCNLNENTRKKLKNTYRKWDAYYTVEETLKQNDDAFCEWRYSFERTEELSILITDVLILWHSIDEYISDLWG